MSNIQVNNLKDLAIVCAQLVREGIEFEASQINTGAYEIRLTGGF